MALGAGIGWLQDKTVVPHLLPSDADTVTGTRILLKWDPALEVPAADCAASYYVPAPSSLPPSHPPCLLKAHTGDLWVC